METAVRGFLEVSARTIARVRPHRHAKQHFQSRTKGIGALTTDDAIEWGMTGANLRACGMDWDFRKRQPYSGYEQFEFDIPTGKTGDCYDRAAVRVEEMRQSLRIIDQCLRNLPEGPYKSDHPLTTRPSKPHDARHRNADHSFPERQLGAGDPAGRGARAIEATKGNNGYYLVSDGSTVSYRTRIRTPSFAHMQTLPCNPED
jgi:NADH-quinone oxidoreductase subunit C/D